MLLADYITVI